MMEEYWLFDTLEKKKEEKERCAGSSGKVEVGCELPDPVLSVHLLEFHSAVLKPDFHLSV